MIILNLYFSKADFYNLYFGIHMSDFKSSRDNGLCQKKELVSYDLSHKKSIDLIKNLWIWVCAHPGISGVFVTAFGGGLFLVICFL